VRVLSALEIGSLRLLLVAAYPLPIPKQRVDAEAPTRES
jgi:hypothetical protein